MSTDTSLDFLNRFEEHYKYDTTYMKEILNVSPEGFKTFENFLPMGRYRKATPKDVYWVTKVAAMKTEDCGACTQLNIRMALEDGIDSNTLKSVINNGKGLSPELKEVYDFAVAVTKNSGNFENIRKKMASKYSQEIMVELSLALASIKVYPAIKRALGHAGSCSLFNFEF